MAKLDNVPADLYDNTQYNAKVLRTVANEVRAYKKFLQTEVLSGKSSCKGPEFIRLKDGASVIVAALDIDLNSLESLLKRAR